MKLLLILPMFFFSALVGDVSVGARPNTDRLNTADAATSDSTSTPLSRPNITERTTDYVKQGLQSATLLGNSDIDEGSDLTTQVLGLIRTIPELGISSEFGKTAVNMANSLETKELNAVNIFEDSNLGFNNNFSQIGTNALSSSVNNRTSLWQDMINTETHGITSVIYTCLDVLQQVIDGIKSLPSEGNHISDSLNVDREGSISTRNIVRVPPR